MAITNPYYLRGYNAGYAKGVRDGISDNLARAVMNRDLIWAYGCMALVLIESHGWTAEEVEELIDDIQTRWKAVGDEDDPDDMATYVLNRTGIELAQKAEEISDL